MNTAVPAPCDAGIAAAAAPTPCFHPVATLAATVLGSCMAFIDGSVVNVALPALQRDLGAGAAELSWTINAYLLPLGALILLGGGMGDHFGRRRLFLAGLATFALSSILCSVAPDFHYLLLGRALQGLGAALLMPNSLAILGASFGGEARGKAIGTWAAVGALAGAIGPLLGGWLVDAVGWRTIFLINPPVAAAAAYLAWTYVPESRDESGSGPLDWAGAGLVTVALGLLTWSLTVASGNDGRWAFWIVVLTGCVTLGLFLRLEARRGKHALMPLAMFKTRSFVGLTLFTFFLYAGLGGLVVLLPYLLIRIAGWSAVMAGATMLPLPILMGLGSPLMGQLTGRYGGRLPLAIGAGIAAIGFALFMRIGAGGIDYQADILPPTLLVAIGMVVCVAPLTTAVMASVGRDYVGTASGFNSAVARIAGLVATALLGYVFTLQGDADIFAGFRMAALIGAISAVLAAGCAFLVEPSDATRPAAGPPT